MDPFIGEIRMFAGAAAPQDWAFCNGQLVQIAQNTALFSILGVTYGGDGKTTFALPNLQGKMPMHWGNGAGLTPRRLGETGGAAAVTLTATELPAHTHPVNVNTDAGDDASPQNNLPGTAMAYSQTANATMNARMFGIAGADQPHNNLPPFQTVNFIICLRGMWPARG